MGSPELGWTSVFGANSRVDIFAGGERSLDFGYLVAAPRDTFGRVLSDPDAGEPAKIISNGGEWKFRFALAHNLYIADQREYLAPTPGGYSVRLEIGADDGKSRSYNIDLSWDGKARDANAALASMRVEIHEA
jgi:hypothetical protein